MGNELFLYGKRGRCFDENSGNTSGQEDQLEDVLEEGDSRGHGVNLSADASKYCSFSNRHVFFTH
ncbi:hypothetical protein COZ60_03490 [Candidatus Bathyarchaeota archaeon CG_4_8_14_3_um_filter_42_8]|nr:MAG: hypothetical protein COZ60_03490 [Candidatus Bathyarchaeota archaeon CG_4_8_14_3_um_filter_42_8]